MFKRRGLRIVPQQARTGISYCEEKVKYGKRKGQPCGLPKQLGSDYCYSHDEAREQDRRWVLERTYELRRQKAMAA